MPPKVTLSGAGQVLSNHFKSNSAHGNNMVAVSKKLMKHLGGPLLTQMGITSETRTPVQFFDNACGTGVLTQEVQATLSKDVLEKSSFFCADFAEPLVGMVKTRAETEGWVNVETKVLDAMDTGLPENSFSHVGVGLGLHLIPEPDRVLEDCQRVLKNGGVFGASTFPTRNRDRFWGPDIRSAFESFPFDAPFPEAMPMQLHDSGKWTEVEWIGSHLKSQGFKEVEVKIAPGTYHIESAEEFVGFFGMMLSYLMNTWWTEETRNAHPVDEVKELLKKHLEEKYGGKGWDISWEVICMTGRVEK